jgi:hypothetical protein
MNLLTEEIRLVRQKNLGPLDFSEIEDQRRNLLGSRARRVSEAVEEITERSCLLDDVVQDFLLIRLEREARDLCLPFLEIFKLRPCSVARDLSAPVTDRTSVFVKFLDFPPSDFQTFAVIPIRQALVTSLDE